MNETMTITFLTLQRFKIKVWWVLHVKCSFNSVLTFLLFFAQQGKVKKDLVEEDDFESSDEEHEDDSHYGNAWSRGIMRLQTGIFGAFKKYNEMVWTCIYVCLLTLFMAYFIASMLYRFGDEGSIRLLVMTILLALFITYFAMHSFFGDRITFYYYWSMIDQDTRDKIARW